VIRLLEVTILDRGTDATLRVPLDQAQKLAEVVMEAVGEMGNWGL